jgi:hypothetical protein
VTWPGLCAVSGSCEYSDAYIGVCSCFKGLDVCLVNIQVKLNIQACICTCAQELLWGS